ncbi:MAG: terminase small subunit [Spirochaetaceae bacterium]|nr:terminase small subunit [Spirochaetaceae bacterium]
MTDKQQRFVDEYMVDLNATQAAIRAGYSPKTAEVIGNQLLKKTLVSNEILKRKAKLSSVANWTAADVLKRLARLADEGYKDSDKIKALELIGRHIGMFQDKVELSGGVRIDPESVKAIVEGFRSQRDVDALADKVGVRHD